MAIASRVPSSQRLGGEGMWALWRQSSQPPKVRGSEGVLGDF